MSEEETRTEVSVNDEYINKYGFHEEENYSFKSRAGLDEQIVRDISRMKKEPQWMTDFRLRSLETFFARPMPNWGSPVLHDIDFSSIYYYIKPTDGQSATWEDVPAEIKNTFDRLGIPEAEKKFLAGVGAQYESEVIYHSLRQGLAEKGVIFTDMDSASARAPGTLPRIFRHDHPVQRQQIRRAQQRGLVGRLVHLCAQGRQDRHAAAGLLPNQRQEHGAV